MKILFLTIAWPSYGEHNIYTDLMDEFVEHGHNVHVACSIEARHDQKTALDKENNIQVLRIKTGNLTKTPFIEKGVANLLVGMQFEKAINQHFGNIKFDLIIMSTPPVALSGVFKSLKHKYGAKTYLLLKDIWPQGIADLGIIRHNGLIFKYFSWQEKRLYDAADYIGCMSLANVKFLNKNYKFSPSKIIEENPNSIKIRRKYSSSKDSVFEKYNIPKNRCIFIYGGNLGKPQGLSFFIKVLRQIDNPNAFFLIVGDGTEAYYVQSKLEKLKLENVRYMHQLPKDDYEQLCDTADVGLLFLDGRYSIPNFPSRLLSYCESSIPILSCTDANTDVGDIIKKYGCGIKTLHGNENAFISAVNKLANDSELRKKMGKNAFKLLEEKYTTKCSYDIIMKHFRG